MNHDDKVCCVLCRKSKESSRTGPLSTNGKVTAHQKCLLYSSGIYCKESPTFHDLFGFSVEDVLEEVKRGSKLTCDKCKKKGATVGCEIRRCQKSYHFPCALKEGAEILQDEDRGTFGLYCSRHSHQQKTVNGLSSTHTHPEVPEDEEVSSSSHQTNTNGTTLSAVAGPSGLGSGSRKKSSKRRLNFTDEHDKTKRQAFARNRFVSDSSENSVSLSDDADLNMFAPLDSDIEEECSSASGQMVRGNPGGRAGSTPGSSQLQKEQREENNDGEGMEESVSLLPPVQSSSSGTVTIGTSPSPPREAVAAEEEDNKAGLRLSMDDGGPPDLPQQSEECSPSSMPALQLSPSACSTSPPPDAPPDPVTDSASFWKGCNAAGCTGAVFSSFISELNRLCGRIQSEQASQEDYDLALRVMKASGKLTELMVQQQEELQKKLGELQKAAAAMEAVVSALSRGAPP